MGLFRKLKTIRPCVSFPESVSLSGLTKSTERLIIIYEEIPTVTRFARSFRITLKKFSRNPFNRKRFNKKIFANNGVPEEINRQNLNQQQ